MFFHYFGPAPFPTGRVQGCFSRMPPGTQFFYVGQCQNIFGRGGASAKLPLTSWECGTGGGRRVDNLCQSCGGEGGLQTKGYQ